MEGGGFLGVRVSNKTDGRYQFLGFLGIQRKIQPCGWKEHDGVNIPSKIHTNQTARSKDISLPSWRVSGRRSDGLM